MKTNPLTFARELLQQLPYRIRVALYVGYLAVAAASWACHLAGVTAVAGLEVADVDRVVWLLAPVFGSVAAANASRSAADRRRSERRASSIGRG